MTKFYTDNGLFEDLPSGGGSPGYATVTTVRSIGSTNQHNVALTAAEIAAGMIRFENTGSCDLTGIVPPSPSQGYILRIFNMGPNDFKPKDNNSGSAASNRFLMVDDVNMRNGQWIEVMYLDGRWRRQIDR